MGKKPKRERQLKRSKTVLLHIHETDSSVYVTYYTNNTCIIADGREAIRWRFRQNRLYIYDTSDTFPCWKDVTEDWVWSKDVEPLSRKIADFKFERIVLRSKKDGTRKDN